MPDKWYYYASNEAEYYCKFEDDVKVPARFIGPYDSRDKAIQAYNEWKTEQMEPDWYEYIE